MKNTPYSKMAATQDGLGRVARKQGIEGQGTQKILRGNHREMDILRIQEKEHQNNELSLVAYMTSKSQGFSG